MLNYWFGNENLGINKWILLQTNELMVPHEIDGDLMMNDRIITVWF